MSQRTKIPIHEKYTLTISEAVQYFSIGIKKMRCLAEDNLGVFSVYNGNRFLIVRAEFEKYLLKNPIMEEEKEEGMKKVDLESKSIFNPEEAIVFYNLSRRKFKKLLDEQKDLSFVAFFRTRKLILREEFERYMAENPEIREELKNGKSYIS